VRFCRSATKSSKDLFADAKICREISKTVEPGI
jgi:hypothetical protein